MSLKLKVIIRPWIFKYKICLVQLLFTDHELIPAKSASLAAMQGSASVSNVRYYPTFKHSPLEKRNEHAWCLQLGYESLRLLIAYQ
jgi:hypothetical protein